MTDRNETTCPRFDDPDLTLARMMQVWPETVAVFIHHRMRCVGCPIRRFHTVEDACRIHGLAKAQFLEELTRSITPARVPR